MSKSAQNSSTDLIIRRYGVVPRLSDSPEVKAEVIRAKEWLKSKLSDGGSVYAVNTGVGDRGETVTSVAS